MIGAACAAGVKPSTATSCAAARISVAILMMSVPGDRAVDMCSDAYGMRLRMDELRTSWTRGFGGTIHGPAWLGKEPGSATLASGNGDLCEAENADGLPDRRPLRRKSSTARSSFRVGGTTLRQSVRSF